MDQIQTRRGISRASFLMVVGMAGTALCLLVPAVLWLREHAPRHGRIHNLSSCAKAVHIADDQFKTMPPYYGAFSAKRPPDSNLQFHVHLLPFIGEQNLYDVPLTSGIVSTYLSTLDTTVSSNGANGCNYPVNFRLFYTQGGLGALATNPDALVYPRLRDSFPDGKSNTLLFATKYMNCGRNGGSLWLDPGKNAPDSPTAATFGASMALWQAAPTLADCDPLAGTAVSFTKKTIQVALCDASVRTVSLGISQATWQAAHTPGANDRLGGDWED